MDYMACSVCEKQVLAASWPYSKVICIPCIEHLYAFNGFGIEAYAWYPVDKAKGRVDYLVSAYNGESYVDRLVREYKQAVRVGACPQCGETHP